MTQTVVKLPTTFTKSWSPGKSLLKNVQLSGTISDPRVPIRWGCHRRRRPTQERDTRLSKVFPSTWPGSSFCWCHHRRGSKFSTLRTSPLVNEALTKLGFPPENPAEISKTVRTSSFQLVVVVRHPTRWKYQIPIQIRSHRKFCPRPKSLSSFRWLSWLA